MVLVAPPQFYGTGAYGACLIIHYPHTPGCTGGYSSNNPSGFAPKRLYTTMNKYLLHTGVIIIAIKRI